MKNSDKLLVGIVTGAIVLVIASLAIVLIRPKPTYQPEDTPQGVAHNYLLALQQEDFEQAYSYLSHTIKNYPLTIDQFERDIRNNSWQFRLGDTSYALEIKSTQIRDNEATVVVEETRFSQGGLFESSQFSTDFNVYLSRDPGTTIWKIIQAETYWNWNWSR
jgi:hypothetical protein